MIFAKLSPLLKTAAKCSPCHDFWRCDTCAALPQRFVKTEPSASHKVLHFPRSWTIHRDKVLCLPPKKDPTTLTRFYSIAPATQNENTTSTHVAKRNISILFARKSTLRTSSWKHFLSTAHRHGLATSLRTHTDGCERLQKPKQRRGTGTHSGEKTNLLYRHKFRMMGKMWKVNFLAILCDLFGMVKWSELKRCWWPPTFGSEKITLSNLVVPSQTPTFWKKLTLKSGRSPAEDAVTFKFNKYLGQFEVYVVFSYVGLIVFFVTGNSLAKIRENLGKNRGGCAPLLLWKMDPGPCCAKMPFLVVGCETQNFCKAFSGHSSSSSVLYLMFTSPGFFVTSRSLDFWFGAKNGPLCFENGDRE